jgi:hypothetical protein
MARERPLEEAFAALTGPQTSPEGDEEGTGRRPAEPAFGALYATRQREEEKQALLERMIWARRSIIDALSTRTVGLKEETDGIYLTVDPPLPQALMRWFVGVNDVPRVALWGKAGKMGCPTWDLPAGGLLVDGTCPGADSAQAIVPSQSRNEQTRHPPPGGKSKLDIDLGKTICSYCYAFEGNYPTILPQTGEILRHWWCRQAVKDGSFSDVVVRGLALTNHWPSAEQVKKSGTQTFNYRGGPLMPVRIHSAGDFFSQEYARAWVEVANRCNELERRIRFWAPTRTWEAWGTEAWRKILDGLDSNEDAEGPNLIVRASAYHVDDPSPGRLHPKNAEGSTSVWRDHNARRKWQGGKLIELKHGKDKRFDYDCPIYTGAATTCGGALCRACWVKPELSVNYETH